jgi:DinB superfamily
MPCNLENVIALLERTPGALDELLRGLPPDWTDTNEGGDTWSPREVVAHLSHADRTDWVAHLLEFGESQPFPTFNRQGQRETLQGKSMAELLEEFASTRAESLNRLRALGICAADMERRCTHQVLGTVTLGELLTTWAAHDITHLHQITRVMAYQVRDSVGPFSKYLGVVHCAAHGAPAGTNP